MQCVIEWLAPGFYKSSSQPLSMIFHHAAAFLLSVVEVVNFAMLRAYYHSGDPGDVFIGDYPRAIATIYAPLATFFITLILFLLKRKKKVDVGEFLFGVLYSLFSVGQFVFIRKMAIGTCCILLPIEEVSIGVLSFLISGIVAGRNKSAKRNGLVACMILFIAYSISILWENWTFNPSIEFFPFCAFLAFFIFTQKIIAMTYDPVNILLLSSGFFMMQGCAVYFGDSPLFFKFALEAIFENKVSSALFGVLGISQSILSVLVMKYYRMDHALLLKSVVLIGLVGFDFATRRGS